MKLELTHKELLLIISAVRNDSAGKWGDERAKRIEELEKKLNREYRRQVINA